MSRTLSEPADPARAGASERRSRCVVIVQSNYIPWKGYFDLIRRADELVLYDDVQYTRRDWRNRNRIKTRDGLQWLTIPVAVKGNYDAPIKEIRVAEVGWAERHWKTIRRAYARAPFFDLYADAVAGMYARAGSDRLSDVNRLFIERIASLLGIPTRISTSMEYPLVAGKTERLVDLCRQLDATEYLSGPSARAYIDADQFAAAGITLTYMDYSGYPDYPQLFPPFEHAVTVLDLLFNTGSRATEYLLPLPRSRP